MTRVYSQSQGKFIDIPDAAGANPTVTTPIPKTSAAGTSPFSNLSPEFVSLAQILFPGKTATGLKAAYDIQQEAKKSQGLSPEDEKQQAKLKSVEESSKILEKNLAEAEGKGPIFGSLLNVANALSGGAAAPQVADYEALRKSLIGPLARAISGEVGVLTDRDIKRAEGLLPKITDSKKLRENKIKNLHDLIGAHTPGGAPATTQSTIPSSTGFTITEVK